MDQLKIISCAPGIPASLAACLSLLALRGSSDLSGSGSFFRSLGCYTGARPTRTDSYLVVGSVCGCEIRLRRTVDLVHNIQTAHGSPPRRQLSGFSSTLFWRSSRMLQRRRWRPSPRVMGRGAVLGWGCGQLAPLPLRGSSRAALPGRSAGAPASAHLNPAAPGALTLRGGGDQRTAMFRRVSRDYLAGSLWPGCEGVDSESGALDFPPGVAISLFPCFHEGQSLQKHRDRETRNSDKPGCRYRQSAGKCRQVLG